MSKHTSITLGDHFERFVAAQIASGRFNNRSEVIRAALRQMEDTERRHAYGGKTNAEFERNLAEVSEAHKDVLDGLSR